MCDAPPCAVRCFADRTVTQLAPAGDGLMISSSAGADWRIERDLGASTAVQLVAQGTGAIVMTTSADALYTVVDGFAPPVQSGRYRRPGPR